MILQQVNLMFIKTDGRRKAVYLRVTGLGSNNLGFGHVYYALHFYKYYDHTQGEKDAKITSNWLLLLLVLRFLWEELLNQKETRRRIK